MKIQCDVCSKGDAAVFCTADEAALCSACDQRVHQANKLASKHLRFSLHHPSSNQFPICDICQEKRAFLFCQQDRAILCRDCDQPIHSANELTQKHCRFLLTGLKLSDKPAIYDHGASFSPMLDSHNSLLSDPKTNPVPISKTLSSTTKVGDSAMNGFTSSISEYLIETLPGWHVEDFLDNCKADDGMLMPFMGSELDEKSNNNSSFSSENMGIWVPQATPAPLYPLEMGTFKDTNHKETTNSKAPNYNNNTRRWSDDGCFTVPQINFPSSGSKRSRTFW